MSHKVLLKLIFGENFMKDVIIYGNLGKQPESRVVDIKKGKRAGEQSFVLEFSVITTNYQRIENENGPDTYKTTAEEWCRCEYWINDEKKAAHLINILQAGSPVIVMGEETCRPYKDKDNNNRIDRLVRVDSISLNLLHPRVEDYQLRPSKSNEASPEEPSADFDDDIPM